MDGQLCVGFIAVVLIVSVIVIVQEGRARRDARDAYDLSLRELQSDPTNSDLHRETLELGRRYAELARNQKGISVFDEVSLMNDLSAACGSSVAIADDRRATSESGNPIALRLQQLDDLRNKGLVSDDEYAGRRAAILAEL